MKHFLSLAVACLLAATSLRAQDAVFAVTPSTTTYAPGGGSIRFDVNVTFNVATSEIAQLGLEITGVPANWALAQVSGANVPSGPARGATNPFEFFYIDTLSLPNPATFSFTVDYPAGLTGTQTFASITGLFRRTGTGTTQQRLTVPNIALTPDTSLPNITSHPVDQAKFTTQNATLTVATTTSGGLSYQWKKDGVNVTAANATGATTDTLTLTNLVTTNAGVYTVEITNGAGTVVSRSAALTVTTSSAPAFSVHPATQTVVAGASVTLTATASGTPAPTFQWRKGTADVPGATGSSLTLNPVQPGDAGSYTVVATNFRGSATSNPGVLTVNFAPTFTTQPTDKTVIVGNSTTFTAVASGDPTPSLQWQGLEPGRSDWFNLIEGVVFVGTTTGTLTINAMQPALDGWKLRAVATNSVSPAAISNVAVLTVHAPPSFVIHPADSTVVLGNSITWSSFASGNPAPSYQWQVQAPGSTDWNDVVDGGPYSGANTRTLTVTATATTLNGAKFRTVATNGIGSPATTTTAVLTVHYPPSFTTHPTSQTVNLGSNVNFSVVVAGNPAPTLQWQKNTSNIGSATSATLTLNNVSGLDVGSYRAIATNGIGTPATSNAATLALNPGVGTFSPGAAAPHTSVLITGAGFTGASAVKFNGVDAKSFTIDSDFQITAVVPALATTGPITITPAAGAILTSATNFTVQPGPKLRWAANRARSTGDENTLLQTFSVQGANPQQMLVRAVGPGLGSLGVTGFMLDPILTIHDSTGAVVATNNDWDPALSSAFTTVGAFALTNGSKDAALLVTLNPGVYTARVTSATPDSGLAYVETYEFPTAGSSDRVVYYSNRNFADTGTNASFSSFTLQGTGSATVLIRAVGAGLGVTGALADPVLRVQQGTTVLATNDNWTSTNVSQAELAAATAAVGAMPLGANDSALLLTLPVDASGYTVHVTGAGGTTGVALAEVFLLDGFLASAYAPALIAPLPDKNINLAGAATFAAPFVGKPAPTLQWQKDTANVPGETALKLAITNATSANNGAYRVVMTNGSGTVTTASATLSVNKAPQTITFPAIGAKTFGTDTSFTLGASASSSLPITYALSAASPGTVATLSGTTVNIVNAGTITITASQPGNNDYQPATPVAQVVTINKGTATISLGGLAATYDGTPKTVTATTTPPGLTVTLTYTPAGGSPTATAPTVAGSYAVAATVSDVNYAGSASSTLVIAKANQTIAFGTIADRTFGDADFTATATASSSLPVAFASSNNAVATVNAATGLVHIVGAGTVTITASQPGDSNYNAAPSVPRTFTITKAAATIALGNLAQTYTGTPRTVSATTTPAGLNVTFTYDGSATAPTNAGSYAVVATIAENNYQGTASGTLVVAKANQTINFAALPSHPLDDLPFALTGTATSNLPLTYTTSNPSSGVVATVSASTVTLVNTGTIDITASQPGDNNYLPAASVTRTLTVLNQSQTLTFAAAQLPNKTFGATPFTITGNSNRRLLITFTTSDANVATVSAGTLNSTTGDTTATVTVVGAGTATITATQAGDSNTAAAPDVPRTLTVAKADQTISFTAPATKTFGDLPFDLTATTTATSLTPTLSIVSGPATIAGNTVTLTGAGSVVVRAAQAGSANYNPAANVDRTITVAKSNQTIAFTLASPIQISTTSVALTGTATSTLPVSYASSNGAVALVSGSTLTIRGLGTTTITASQAGNNDFNAAPNVTQTLVVNPVAPTISLPATTATAIVGSSFLYGPIGINATALPVTFTMSGAPIGLSVNPASGNISGVPTSANTATSYTITLTATNATASHSQSFALTLQPPAPIITSPAAASATAAAPFTYTTTATPGSGVTFSSTNLPVWLTLNPTTGVLSGIAPTSASVTTVNLTATNATAATTLPLVITVALPANAPVYAGPLNPSGTAGTSFTFTPNFGTGATTYVLIGTLPAGVAQAANFASTGTITGTPTVAGVFPIIISATRVGISTAATLSLTINPAATAPVISFPAGGNVRSATVGTAIANIQLGATPAATSFTLVSGSSLPAGITLSPTGLVAGTPTGAGTFTALIEASNTAGTGPRATLVFNVAPHPQAPIITSSALVSARVGTLLNYALTNSPNLGGTTYAATGTLPTGLAFTGGTTGTIAGTPAAGTQGTYEIFVTGTNTNGTGPALRLSVVVAPPLNVPIITSNGGASGQVGQPFSYQIAATNGPILSYAVSGTLPTGVTHTNGVISGVPSTTAGSPATLTLTATNADGTSLPKTLTLTISPAPATPVITSATALNGRVGTAFTHTVTASESATSFAARNLPAGLVLAPTTGAITGTPTVSGTFVAALAAANTAGLGAETNVTFNIAPAPTAPSITSPATIAGQVGSALSYQIAATPAATSYAVTGTLPGGLALNSATGAITGNPTQAGTFTVQLTATSDGGTSLPQPLTLTIAPDPNVPAITSATTAFGTAGANFNYTITATNLGSGPPYASSVSFDAVRLPSGLVVNTSTGVIQGTPTDVGSSVASLVATNASGTSPARDLTITIQPPANAPAVTSPASALAQVGVNFSYQITGSFSPTSYEVTGAPAWMTVNNASGAIAGTPPNPPGVLALFLRARNATGVSNPQLLLITISPAANTPVVTSVRAAGGTAGTAFTPYQIVAAVPVGAPAVTSYLAPGLPAGLVLDSATGLITGTPLVSGTFNVALTAINANGYGAPVTLVLTIAPSISIGN